VHGEKRGRQLGFPTANMAVWDEQVIPANGIYASWARLGDERFMAATNVGVRPHFQGHTVTVEPYLLDFDRDIYGEQLEITFETRLRPEAKFNSLQDLIDQIGRDGAMRMAVRIQRTIGALMMGQFGPVRELGSACGDEFEGEFVHSNGEPFRHAAAQGEFIFKGDGLMVHRSDQAGGRLTGRPVSANKLFHNFHGIVRPENWQAGTAARVGLRPTSGPAAESYSDNRRRLSGGRPRHRQI